MTRFVLTIVAFALAACATVPPGETPPERPPVSPERVEFAASLVLGYVNNFQIVYGDDWLRRIDRIEQLLVLNGCTTLTTALIRYEGVPLSVAENAVALCDQIRAGIMAPASAPVPLEKPA